MTNYKKIVQDFASRTKDNLRFIEDSLNKPGVKVYEVTQLINSLLGLLVFPQQEFFDKIPETPMDALETEGWPRIYTNPNYKKLSDLKTFMRYFRNAISHFNVEFLVDGENNIRGLRVWNHIDGDKKKPKNWEIDLTLDDIKIITDKFLGLVL